MLLFQIAYLPQIGAIRYAKISAPRMIDMIHILKEGKFYTALMAIDEEEWHDTG